jgi:hypothetical protein
LYRKVASCDQRFEDGISSKFNSYATITWIKQKDEFMQLISKYAAVKALGITPAMLRSWLKTQHEIESLSRETRKNRAHNTICQEPELKARLTAEFNLSGF